MKVKELIGEALLKATGKRLSVENIKSQGGGCINNAVTVETNGGFFFIKYNERTPADMFEKEFRGLSVLHETGFISIPEPLGFGDIDGKGYIVMTGIQSAPPIKNFWTDFGAKLAALHRNFSNDRYGLDHNNYIGRLPQVNDWLDNWIDFFIRNRIEVQLKMAVDNHLVDEGLSVKFPVFYKKLPDLLPVERPCLLHGDLWSGNFMTGHDGKAVLIDPAIYYGHREAELSFTQMFGGFDDEFYRSYEETWPLEKGFDSRVDIYNLYPTLVHLNLFGPMYLGGVKRVIEKYT